jgi:hypothetical protein
VSRTQEGYSGQFGSEHAKQRYYEDSMLNSGTIRKYQMFNGSQSTMLGWANWAVLGYSCQSTKLKRELGVNSDEDCSAFPIHFGSGFIIENRRVPTLLASANVAHDFALLSGEEIGLLQSFRQRLIAEAGFIHRNLESIETLLGPHLSPCGAVRDINVTKICSAAELGVSSDMGQVPKSPYNGPVQQEFLSHTFSSFIRIQSLLWSLLLEVRKVVRLIDLVLSGLRSSGVFPVIFCSVPWEKRRWFLFHGARPPKSNAKAMWTRLSGVRSGSHLA